MKRRALIVSALASAVSFPALGNSQTAPMPVVGFLRSSPAAPFAHIVSAFNQGLRDAGFVDGDNVIIEYRWADNDLKRLPSLAEELIAKKAGVIVGNSLAIDAARAASSEIPIVFVTADDPIKSGLVTSLSKPGSNLTGITFFAGGQLGAKRLEIIHELVPSAKKVGILVDPNYPAFQGELPNVVEAARILGIETIPIQLADVTEFERAFAEMVAAGIEAILVGGSPYFTGKRKELVNQAAVHRLPTIYDQRDHVVAGGLVSYAASFTAAYRQAGEYAGRILKGERPGDLPVLQPTTFELVVNLRAANALNLEVPQSIMLRADEVIEE